MFKSKTHEINFYNAMKEVDSENFATQAVVYLLTSETTLWGKVKKHFKDGYIDALALHPKASSKNAYALLYKKQGESIAFFVREIRGYQLTVTVIYHYGASS